MSRTILITGGSKRIGATIAKSLAASGHKVIVHYNSSHTEAAALQTEIRNLGGACEIIQADFSKIEDIQSLIPRCVGQFGPLNCLINNASTFVNDTIQTVVPANIDLHMMPNLVAPLFLSQAFSNLPELGEDPCIINMLDQKVFNLNPDFISYTLSKVALGGLTQMLAMAFAKRIRVCGIAPGVTLISGKQTPESFDKAWRATPTGRSSTPEEIASTVTFILATRSFTGQSIIIDGGETLRKRARDVAFDLDD